MQTGIGSLLTAMVTPFAADGSLNLDSARRLAHHLVDTGSDGIVVCGTTGEGPTVTDREKLDLLEAIVTEVGAGATVIANTGSYDTHHSVALTRSALATGVDGFLVVTPYYSKPPRAGIVAHFRAIADAADGRPVIVYNIPQRVVLNLEPDVLAELATIPNVVAVKQATADLDQARRIVDETGLVLYAGNDDLVLPFLELGGAGGICVASHIAGRQIRSVIELAHRATWPGRERSTSRSMGSTPASRSRPTRSRSRRRSTSSGTMSAACGSRSSRPTPARLRPSPQHSKPPASWREPRHA